MKNLIFTCLLFVFIANISKAQFVEIPDSNFRKILKSKYPTCFNGSNQMNSNCSVIVNEGSLNVSNKNIYSLEGIQYFKKLKYLNCFNNQLSSLPILPGSITVLYCFNNQLSTLPDLPSSLINFDCNNNKLSNLPNLPSSLIYLNCGSNQLSSLPIFTGSIKSLNCSNNQLTNLPSLPSSLTELICFGNKLNTLPSLPTSLTKLHIAYNQLISLPILPNSITEFHCNNNQLTSLPNIPNSLPIFNCYSNKLTSLPNLPSSISYIDCSFNQLINLPSLPNSLSSLDCSNNQLSNLPSLPNSLKKLICYYNQLGSLPSLPNSLIDFSCFSNKLINLPNLPNSLPYLICSNNQLVSLPDLPSSITNIVCSNNQLISLPTLPGSITRLICSNNQLSSLPSLPSSIKLLYCSENQLSSLPGLPDLLDVLSCDKNQLISLPSLPSLLNELYCNNNPLNCLPILPDNLSVVTLSSTNIKCLPNRPTNLFIDTIIPICTDPSDICQVNAFAKGLVYNDVNNNGIFNPNSESTISNQIINVTPNEWKGISDINGEYWVSLDTTINNTWSCTPTNKYATISPNSYSATPTGLGLLPNDYNFGIHFTPNVKDLEATLAGTAVRPGFKTNIGVTANNIGTINQTNVTIKLKKPAGYDVTATSTPITSTLNDTLFWKNVPIDFLQKQSFYVELQLPVSAVLGAEIIYEAWVNGTQGDTTPIDNYTKWIDTVSGSFDPNDKLVSKTTLPPAYDVEKDRLIYTIRFQNTGTDTAFYVRVKDEIPSNLNLSTLRVINASHTYQLIVREKNIVEFAFPNILLPDKTTNEPKSHGFVQFSIQPKVGLPVNTKIENNASIYFDYYAPIITNFATTQVKLTTGLANNKNLDFKLYPNPTNGTIRIELPYNGNGNWTLSDISGRQLKADNIANDEKLMELNLNDLPSGTYFITIQLGENVSTAKIVKM